MSAALNSVIIFRRQNGDILWQRHLKLVYFIVKSSWYNSQIKYFFKERRPRLNAALEWAPQLKLWKFKERRGAQTRKYGTDIAQHTPYQSFSVTGFTYCYFRNTLSILTQVTLNMPSYSIIIITIIITILPAPKRAFQQVITNHLYATNNIYTPTNIHTYIHTKQIKIL
jgi:hypothetical protein